MADFVLVHGAWGGAWTWKRVLPALWQTGHRAFAVSLTGVGERAHALSPLVTLETHIADVQAVIEAEELQSAILVGHSYSGMVVTGVAARLADASRLARLVYLDAVVPRPGESWSSGHAPDTQAARRRATAEAGGIPPAHPPLYGLVVADPRGGVAWNKREQEQTLLRGHARQPPAGAGQHNKEHAWTCWRPLGERRVRRRRPAATSWIGGANWSRVSAARPQCR